MTGSIRHLFDSGTGCIHIRPQAEKTVRSHKVTDDLDVRHQMEIDVCLNCKKPKCTGTTKCMIEAMRAKYGEAAVAMYISQSGR